jgi:hypothetical protein
MGLFAVMTKATKVMTGVATVLAAAVGLVKVVGEGTKGIDYLTAEYHQHHHHAEVEAATAALATAREEWNTVRMEFEASNPRPSPFWTVLLVFSMLGGLLGLIGMLVVSAQKDWTGTIIPLTVVVLCVVGGWLGAHRGPRLDARREARLQVLWAPYSARIERLRYEVENERESADS